MDPVPPSDDLSIRFDLSGNILSAEERESIPVSHGLHHHGASPDLAGYSMDDVLVLCRSSVPGQRIKMLNLLAEIIRRYSLSTDEVGELLREQKVTGQALALASEILASPPRAIGLHIAAIDLLHRCLVPDDADLDAVEIRPSSIDIPSVEWEPLLPGLQLILCEDTGLPLGSLDRVVASLRWASLASQDNADAIFALLPRITRTLVLAKPWPLDSANPPSTAIIRLANDLIRSSRGCAEAFMHAKLAEPLLRYLIPATWPYSIPPDIATGVIETYTLLARYGLGAELVSSSLDVFREMGASLRIRTASSGLTAYLNLLAAWKTCAIDPHRTTPEHTLTWARVAGIGWADEALEVLPDWELLSGHSEVAEAALGLLIAWLVGVEINTSDKGANEKARVSQRLAGHALGRLVESALESRTINQSLLASLVEVDLILWTPGSNGDLSQEERQELISLLDATNGDSNARLWYHLTNLAARIGAAPTNRLAHMFELFHAFTPSEEHLALSLLDDLLKFDFASPTRPTVDLQILRPLLQYTILPSAKSIVGPCPPVHPYLKATTTLLRSSSPSNFGLPLVRDWLFSPLNELLHSANSAALEQTPPDWNPSETEIVRATLVLVQHQLAAVPNAVTRSEILFNLMKVFMLENEQDSGTSDGEVFRDPVVSEKIAGLLQRTTSHRSSPTPLEPEGDAVNQQSESLAPLELVAKAFLGDDSPFFQFYTDFVALFEAISYSDTSFAQVLVPPLAMGYPIDYRRLVWIDHPQLARLVRLKISEVPLEEGAFEGYLEPMETDEAVLNAYAQALTRRWITKDRSEFMWTLAMSHLLHILWSYEEVGARLLKSIVNSGSKAAMNDLLALSIDSKGRCDEVTDDVKQERLDRVQTVFNPEIRAKVEALL